MTWWPEGQVWRVSRSMRASEAQSPHPSPTSLMPALYHASLRDGPSSTKPAILIHNVPE